MDDTANNKKEEANEEMGKLLAKGVDNVTQGEAQRVTDMFIDAVLAQAKG